MKNTIAVPQSIANFFPALKFLLKIFALVILAAVFCSCVGVKMDMTVRADGSVTMSLEYRVSRMLESLGRLDGNERWPVIPTGKEDFQRTMARLPRLSLTSFSSSDDGTDLISKAVIASKNIEDMLGFLDPSSAQQGSRVVHEQANGKNRLMLVLLDGNLSIEPELLALADSTFAGYTLGFSLSVPGDASLVLTDSSGAQLKTVPESARLTQQGKKTSFSMDMKDLFKLSDGLGLEFTW